MSLPLFNFVTPLQKSSSAHYASQKQIFTRSRLASVIALALLPLSSVYADSTINKEINKEIHVDKTTNNNIETLTITSRKSDHTQRVISPTVSVAPDVSEWLSTMPGASINQNGKVTGIAQYRGLYGDRVAVKLNGHSISGAGPNAMDTPLSYSPSITTESIQVFRGIAPVSAAIETLGGAVIVNNVKAQLSETNKWITSGKVHASYADVNEGKKLALRTNVANKTFGIMAYVDSNEAENTESGYGYSVVPTGYSKIQSGVDLRWQTSSQNLLGFSYDYTDTQNAGTPALPMDITSIFGHRFNLDGTYDLSGNELIWQLGYMEADHVMDNFSERENLTPDSFRENTAASQTVDFAIRYKENDAYGDTVWQLGIEGFTTEHDATITNPNNAMFNVVNFNAVEESKLSVFSQWDTIMGANHITTGIRVNYIESDAGDVNHHMAMMNANVGTLVSEFNNADRSVDDLMFDFTSEIQHTINDNLLVSVAIGRKERSPSYQERYLWFPMEATAGLADGNTYIGNINLDSEVAYQTNLGLSYKEAGLRIEIDTFYQYIDGYIQGLSSENMANNMVASMMMGDDNLLEFSNVDARLYGIDGAISYQFNDMWSLNSTLSYVRGKRTDIEDDLYRMAPLNGDISLQFKHDDWSHNIAMRAVAKQTNIAVLNEEEKSAGYTTFTLKTEYKGFDELKISAGIDNVFDKAYTDHLGGYNRVNDAVVTEKDRIPADGRNVWVALRYSF